MNRSMNEIIEQVRGWDLANLVKLNRALIEHIKAVRSVKDTGAAFDLRGSEGKTVRVRSPKRGARLARLIEARRTRCLVEFQNDPGKQWLVPANWVEVVEGAPLVPERSVGGLVDVTTREQ
jgi:hypothetical protein